jgi:NADPH-dependent glutamate synthase beta subunit-like oxidoreductase
MVKGIICEKMERGEPDASGRRRPVKISGSEFEVGADCIIMSIGTSPNPLIKDTTEVLLPINGEELLRMKRRTDFPEKVFTQEETQKQGQQL